MCNKQLAFLVSWVPRHRRIARDAHKWIYWLKSNYQCEIFCEIRWKRGRTKHSKRSMNAAGIENMVPTLKQSMFRCKRNLFDQNHFSLARESRRHSFGSEYSSDEIAFVAAWYGYIFLLSRCRLLTALQVHTWTPTSNFQPLRVP